MRWRMISLTAVVVFVSGVVPEAVACGDKFLVVGRGARFQRGYVAVHPASLLLIDTKRNAGEILQPLRRAGHRVDVAHNVDEVRRAVAGKTYDVVLADWSAVPEVRPMVSSAAPSAVFLPVLNGATTADIESATRLYGCPLDATKAKAKRSFLARLDDVIEAKRKSKPMICKVED